MLAKLTSSLPVSRAETAFRNAFDRLKCGKPNLLPKGTPVSQNNVSREAGCDSSALKKSRFPGLVEEIQRWVEERGGAVPATARQSVLTQRRKNRGLRQRIEALEQQRDKALGFLAEADSRILELTIENSRLEALLSTTKPKSIFGRKREK